MATLPPHPDDHVGGPGAVQRWLLVRCSQAAKNETGLDQYQVRRYDGWHRHITLAMIAHAYLAVTGPCSIVS